MENKEMNMIIKIIGLVGAIFVLIAQFVPWGTGAYLFGADLWNWDIFYVQMIETGINAQIWQYILVGILMIILFIINIVTITFGFLTFSKVESHGVEKFLTPAILATVEFTLYIVGWGVATGGILGSGILHIGFVMILLAMIMFWVTFGLGKAFFITTTPVMYQQPLYQQPPMMYSTPQKPTAAPQPQAPSDQTPHPIKDTPSNNKTVPKFCSQCGSALQPNAKFCPSCGNKL